MLGSCADICLPSSRITSLIGKTTITTTHFKSRFPFGNGEERTSRSSEVEHSMEMDKLGMMGLLVVKFWYAATRPPPSEEDVLTWYTCRIPQIHIFVLTFSTLRMRRICTSRE